MQYRITHNNCTINTHALCIPGIVLHFLWHCVQWRVQAANVVVLRAPIALYQQMLPCGQVAHTTSASNKHREVLSPDCFEIHRTLETKPDTATYLTTLTLHTRTALTQCPCSPPPSSLSFPGGQAGAHPIVSTGWWTHTLAPPTPPPAGVDAALQQTIAPAAHAEPHPSHLHPAPVTGSSLL